MHCVVAWLRVRVPALLVVFCVFAWPTSAHAQWPPTSLENLQVLPSDITVQELVQMMSGFTRALGVRCSFCHVGDPNGSISEYDFPSDEKATKRKARQMIGMVNRINGETLAGLEERVTPPVEVQCVTCHRGVSQPRQLEDILGQAYRGGGIDSALTTYGRLREAYYGRSAYDFGDVPLVQAASSVAASGSTDDAIRLLELNVEMNSGSVFARTQLLNLAIATAFAERGAEAGSQAYLGFRNRFGAATLPETLLNTIGYSLLRRGLVDAAVRSFELNVEAYPRSGNVYDSLGEGLAARGDTAAAIRAYTRSLELTPDNANAIERLRLLRGGG